MCPTSIAFGGRLGPLFGRFTSVSVLAPARSSQAQRRTSIDGATYTAKPLASLRHLSAASNQGVKVPNHLVVLVELLDDMGRRRRRARKLAAVSVTMRINGWMPSAAKGTPMEEPEGGCCHLVGRVFGVQES